MEKSGFIKRLLHKILTFFVSYDVFISYADEDFEKAEEIAIYLKNKGIRAFVAKISLEHGSNWEKEIKSNLDITNLFTFLISSNSLKSVYALPEFGSAWGSNKEILPIKVEEKNFSKEELGWIANMQIADYFNKEGFWEQLQKRIYKIYFKRGIVWVIFLVIIILAIIR